MDKETVITHLQIIKTWAEFARERDLNFFTKKHLEDIAKWADDALKLLKEQEAVEPNPVYNSFRWFACGKCDCSITREDRFCPRCGQAVKWE